jgi:protein phosphatase
MEHVAAVSHKGRKRAKNEDAVLAVVLPGGGVLLAVADGVGGAPAGEIASRDSTRILHDQMLQHAELPVSEQLATAVQNANLGIWRRQQTEERLNGMATTLVVAHVDNHRAWLANVGDSRASIVREGQLLQITDDHSLVAEQLRAGEITEEEAWESNARNIITRTLGSVEEIDVDIFGPYDLKPGDRLLLSSDGLHDVVEPREIAAIATDGPPEHAANMLIEAANALGGPDNISVVLYAEPEAPSQQDSEAETMQTSRYVLASTTN